MMLTHIEPKTKEDEMTDVNAAFAAERTALISSLENQAADALARASKYNRDIDARIEAGTLVPIGVDRYRVDDPGSWDNGEVWTYRKITPNAPALLLPQHGLDETAGQVALYTSTPAWHSLGNVIPGGTSDVNQVLKLGGIDWLVKQYAAQFTGPDGIQDVPGQFVNVREDTGAPLGIVGRVYRPFQNETIFSFLQELAGTDEVTWESAGALREGRRVFVCMKFPETLRIDADGINDEVEQFIAFMNSHDGTSPAQGVVTPWRPVCGNTERFAMRDAVTKWSIRHTVNAPQKVAEAMRSLQLSRKYYDRFREEEETLARNEMLLDEFRALLFEEFPREDNETKATKTKRDNRESALMNLYGTESARVGRTAYAAERTFTGYWDNLAGRNGDNLKAARATAVMEGSDDEKKTRIHKKLMLRVA
jgi:phage/plasmid-like protein (TIGR03299 family)